MKVQIGITFHVCATTGVVDSVTFDTPHFCGYPLEDKAPDIEKPTPIEKMLLEALEEITTADTISRSARIALDAMATAEEMARKEEHGIHTEDAG